MFSDPLKPRDPQEHHIFPLSIILNLHLKFVPFQLLVMIGGLVQQNEQRRFLLSQKAFAVPLTLPYARFQISILVVVLRKICLGFQYGT